MRGGVRVRVEAELHGKEGPAVWKPRRGGALQNTHLVGVPPVTQVSGSLKSERR